MFVAIFALPCGPVNYARMRHYRITAFDVVFRRIIVVRCSCYYSSLRLSQQQHSGGVLHSMSSEMCRFSIPRCASEDYIFEPSNVVCIDRAVFSLVARRDYMFDAASFSYFPTFWQITLWVHLALPTFISGCENAKRIHFRDGGGTAKSIVLREFIVHSTVVVG